MQPFVQILAEAAPANHADWLSNLNWAVTFMFGLIVLWDRISNRPQKREVSFSEEYVGREEFKRLREDVDALEEKLDDMKVQMSEDKDQILSAGEARATRIHERIEGMEKEIHQLPGQVFALIRNAKGL